MEDSSAAKKAEKEKQLRDIFNNHIKCHAPYYIEEPNIWNKIFSFKLVGEDSAYDNKDI